jgi:hypothetical protein
MLDLKAEDQLAIFSGWESAIPPANINANTGVNRPTSQRSALLGCTGVVHRWSLPTESTTRHSATVRSQDIRIRFTIHSSSAMIPSNRCFEGGLASYALDVVEHAYLAARFHLACATCHSGTGGCLCAPSLLVLATVLALLLPVP